MCLWRFLRNGIKWKPYQAHWMRGYAFLTLFTISSDDPFGNVIVCMILTRQAKRCCCTFSMAMLWNVDDNEIKWAYSICVKTREMTIL